MRAYSPDTELAAGKAKYNRLSASRRIAGIRAMLSFNNKQMHCIA